jgi:EAL domain-containing protein (putative c-di-GMP-specific phosphodiesterase class I)
MHCGTGRWWAYYQLEVELSTGRVVAVESLAQREHPELGTLPPALFTPVAERLGLMGELTRLMLKQSLAQHRAWAAAGMVVPVAVNVGPDSVTDPGFPAVVTELLRHEQVAGPMLALEVSEQPRSGCAGSSTRSASVPWPPPWSSWRSTGCGRSSAGAATSTRP